MRARVTEMTASISSPRDQKTYGRDSMELRCCMGELEDIERKSKAALAELPGAASLAPEMLVPVLSSPRGHVGQDPVGDTDTLVETIDSDDVWGPSWWPCDKLASDDWRSTKNKLENESASARQARARAQVHLQDYPRTVPRTVAQWSAAASSSSSTCASASLPEDSQDTYAQRESVRNIVRKRVVPELIPQKRFKSSFAQRSKKPRRMRGGVKRTSKKDNRWWKKVWFHPEVANIPAPKFLSTEEAGKIEEAKEKRKWEKFLQQEAGSR